MERPEDGEFVDCIEEDFVVMDHVVPCERPPGRETIAPINVSFPCDAPALEIGWAGQTHGNELYVLPDTGAVLNSCGKAWAVRATRLAKEKGVPVQWREHTPSFTAALAEHRADGPLSCQSIWARARSI